MGGPVVAAAVRGLMSARETSTTLLAESLCVGLRSCCSGVGGCGVESVFVAVWVVSNGESLPATRRPLAVDVVAPLDELALRHALEQ